MLRWTCRLATVGLAVFAALAISSSAWGLAYTLDADIAFDDATTGLKGTIRAVTNGAGATDTSGSSTVFGSVNFGTQDIFVVDITLDAASSALDILGVTVGVNPFTWPVGGGYFNDGLNAPDAVQVNLFFSFRTDYVFNPGNLVAGETSVRLFTTYTTGMAIGQTASFMLSPAVGAGDFTMQGTIVPEPGTALLVASGIALLAARQRRRGLR